MKTQNIILLITVLIFGCWTVTTEMPSDSETSLEAYFNKYGGKENFQQHYVMP